MKNNLKIAAMLLSAMVLGQSARGAVKDKDFVIALSEDSQSNVEVILPESPTADVPMVVICPGGAYSHLAMQHEGTDWSPFFNSQGIACAVVKYRMPNGDSSLPIEDAEKAIALVRANASEWGVNPNKVGIMGFSAGGHLASTVATRSEGVAKPDFQILFYPVITMENGDMHEGSTRNLLGAGAEDAAVRHQFSNYNNVSVDTPPAILLLSNDDRTVPPVGNSVAYYSALKRNGVDAAMHVYPHGGHGWGMNKNFEHHEQMLSDFRAWLEAYVLK